MTKLDSGSSLPQARVDAHSHNHGHVKRHGHSHERLHKRDEVDDGVTEIIQTISVVQIIDATGSIISLTTVSSTPTSVELNPSSDPSASDVSQTPENNGSASLSTPAPTTEPAVTSSQSMPPSFPSVESYSPVTATPLSGSSFRSFPAVTNSTQVGPSGSSLPFNSTASLRTLVGTGSSSTLTASLSSSSISGSSSSSLFDGSSTLTSSIANSVSSTFSSSGTGVFTVTNGGFSGATGATAGSPAATSTVESGSGAGSGSSTTTTQAATIAGSVIGGVAGVAFILILALMLLRWKKRNPAGILTGDGAPGSGRALPGTGGSPSPNMGGGQVMSQARGAPFAIPAALASLTGHKRFSQRTTTSSEGGERGFYKVSGKKLPSVLQSGGDGYSDPRDTMLSDQSFYRDSQGYHGGPSMPRVAVGSPMRPESGIPVFHAGPARTPVTEQGPFSDRYALDTPLPPPPQRDPLGRSHPSQDGSNRSQGSGSRFTEDI